MGGKCSPGNTPDSTSGDCRFESGPALQGAHTPRLAKVRAILTPSAGCHDPADNTPLSSWGYQLHPMGSWCRSFLSLSPVRRAGRRPPRRRLVRFQPPPVLSLGQHHPGLDRQGRAGASAWPRRNPQISADVGQWQSASFPSWIRGFDPRHRLQPILA